MEFMVLFVSANVRPAEVVEWLQARLALPDGAILGETADAAPGYGSTVRIHIVGQDEGPTHSLPAVQAWNLARSLGSDTQFTSRFGTASVVGPSAAASREESSGVPLAAWLAPVIVVVVLLLILLVVLVFCCLRSSSSTAPVEEKEAAPVPKEAAAPPVEEKVAPAAAPAVPPMEMGVVQPLPMVGGQHAYVLPEEDVGDADDEWPPPTVLEVVASEQAEFPGQRTY
eukprot:TRINITY_DN274_c1_g1_i1.p2 TRINITY_DN274_c1_g1~~TRINITY_DN274_c1_g1_i1.p2  ORF type:complete len:227 (-),score=95.25 TRINITY_DN274_c1_g1_i1:370-1050(-)